MWVPIVALTVVTLNSTLPIIELHKATLSPGVQASTCRHLRASTMMYATRQSWMWVPIVTLKIVTLNSTLRIIDFHKATLSPCVPASTCHQLRVNENVRHKTVLDVGSRSYSHNSYPQFYVTHQ